MATQVLKIPGRTTAFVMDGFDLSNNYNEYKFKRDAALIDATGFGQRFSYGLAGIQKCTLDMKGFYTPGLGNIDFLSHQRFGQDTDVLLGLAPYGYTVLNPAVIMPTVITKYDMDAKNKDAVLLDMEFAARGAVDDGFILSDPRTLITVTGASSVLDYTATTGATTAGCSAQVHVLSVAGTTPSITAKIQHSATVGGTYTDLITFGAQTAVGALRSTIDAGTTVQPCIKASWTVSGTLPVLGVFIAFSRGVAYI
jgi:hypothetical protein